MPEENKTTILTHGLPTFYANNAGLTIGYNDIRLYLAEAVPTTVDLGPSTPGFKQLAISTNPIACIILNPEFAKSLRDSLNEAVEKYQAAFGPLRPAPTLPLDAKK